MDSHLFTVQQRSLHILEICINIRKQFTNGIVWSVSFAIQPVSGLIIFNKLLWFSHSFKSYVNLRKKITYSDYYIFWIR